VFSRIAAVLGIVWLVSLSGCSDAGGTLNLARVKGKVLYKDQPLAGANVQFADANGQIASGNTDSQGIFTLTTAGRPGVLVGEHKVTITKLEEIEAAAAGKAPAQMTPEDMMRMQREGASSGGGPAGPPKSLIPEKYSQADTSGLSATVSENEAENDFEFRLVD
jgi:hypothetical protein